MSNGRFLCRLGPDLSARLKGDVPLLCASFPKLRGEGVGALDNFLIDLVAIKARNGQLNGYPLVHECVSEGDG